MFCLKCKQRNTVVRNGGHNTLSIISLLECSQWRSQATGLLLNIVLVKHFQHIKSIRIPYPYFFGFILSRIQSEGGKSGLEKL